MKDTKENYLVRSDYAPFSSENETKIFIRTIGDDYVKGKALELSDDELSRLALTEGAEMCRLYQWLHTKVSPDDTEEKQLATQKRLSRIGAVLGEKLLSAEYVYCLYSRITGKPHLFSSTVKQGESYACTAPNIRVFTETYLAQAKKIFPDRFFELRKIENGADREGITFFLADCFFLYGAMGVEILGDFAPLGADMLVPAPDLSEVDEKDIPVMNPGLKRWLLLAAQMPHQTSDEEKLIAKLYYRFAANEAVKARLLVPIVPAGESDSAVMEMKSGEKYVIKTLADGKHERPAAAAYTDLKTLAENTGGKKYLSMTISQIIDAFDVVIDPSGKYRTGLYIDKKMFEDMKRISGVEDKK